MPIEIPFFVCGIQYHKIRKPISYQLLMYTYGIYMCGRKPQIPVYVHFLISKALPEFYTEFQTKYYYELCARTEKILRTVCNKCSGELSCYAGICLYVQRVNIVNVYNTKSRLVLLLHIPCCFMFIFYNLARITYRKNILVKRGKHVCTNMQYDRGFN